MGWETNGYSDGDFRRALRVEGWNMLQNFKKKKGACIYEGDVAEQALSDVTSTNCC